MWSENEAVFALFTPNRAQNTIFYTIATYCLQTNITLNPHDGFHQFATPLRSLIQLIKFEKRDNHET